MDETSQKKRLENAITQLAATITEVINERLRTSAELEAPHPLMTKKQLAQQMAVSLRTIDTLLKRGYLPYFRITSRVRFDWKEVEAILKTRLKVRSRLQD